VDRWRNDISGRQAGPQGTGTLKLAGANSWTGGTELTAGTLQGESVTRLARATSTTAAARRRPAPAAPAGHTQLTGGTTLELALGGATAGSAGTVIVSGTATIAGGTLRIKFANGYKPKAGDVLNVITAGSLKGQVQQHHRGRLQQRHGQLRRHRADPEPAKPVMRRRHAV
jgi:autotransporter-associated beta strand protein